jgi:polyhydroxybutyrate depolymerase
VGFARDVVHKLERQLKVDAARVYGVGFSNGAFMAHRLGTSLPDVFAGIAVVEGTFGFRQENGQFLNVPTPRAPMPVAIFHGMKDDHVLYEGGVAPGGHHLDAEPVSAAVQMWTKADHCAPIPETQTLPEGNVVSDYKACAGGSEVVLYTLVQGIHQYPTSQNAAKLGATDAIWEFLSRHAKQAATRPVP